MTQHAQILRHLKTAGSITVREALVEYSVASLTKRIQELREQGHDIISTVKHHPVTQQRYVRYSLAARAAAQKTEDVVAEMKALELRDDLIFAKLEEAVTVSVEPLDQMFEDAGLSTDDLIASSFAVRAAPDRSTPPPAK